MRVALRALAAGIALLGLPALAQSPVQTGTSGGASGLPQQLSLPVLMRLVAERSPRLAAEQVAIEAARADRITAGALPNPTFSYGRYKPSGGSNTLFDGSRQQQFSVDLPILISGQRGARIEAAEQGILAAQARVGLVGKELALRAAELFIELQAAQEKTARVESALGEIRKVVDIVSGRMESGVASRFDLTRVEVERAAMEARLAEARNDQAEKAAGLAALLGAPGWQPSALGPVSTPAATAEAGVSDWYERVMAGNPQVLAARREVEAARAALNRTDRDTLPVPVLSVGRQSTADPYGSANFIGLSAEFPLSDSRKGQIARSSAELSAAERRREAVEAEANVELRRLLEALTQRRTALERFNKDVSMRIPAMRQMAEDAYRLGRGGILDLMDASRSRLDVQLTEVDLRTETARQELRLLALTGKLGE